MKLAFALFTTLAAVPVFAHEGHGTDMDKLWSGMLAKPPIAVGAAFDRNGELWLARVEAGQLKVSHSADRGKTFSAPIAVNPAPEDIAADGENRPKLLVVGNGNIYVSYTQHLAKPMTGDVRFSRSTDGGQTFSAPITVNDNHDMISHRFEAMTLGPQGRITMAWLDKRDQAETRKAGKAYTGAALYFAVSSDAGASFGANHKLADHACECCRVALATDVDGVPIAAWRHVFDGNIRDHALQRLDGLSPLRRVNRDAWKVDACPHHGPALSVGEDGTQHVVWFSEGGKRKGLFYARSTDQGKNFSKPHAFGNRNAQAGRPAVATQGKVVAVVWKEFDGKVSSVQGMISSDNGKRWKSLKAVATTAGPSDHPQIIANPADHQLYLSWNTAQDDYKLVALAP